MEIQSYQELTTYAGTTIVKNDADCYMECTYKASGNEYGDACANRKI